MQWADQTASAVPLLIADRSVMSASRSGAAPGSRSTRNWRHSSNIAGSHDSPFAPLPRLTSNFGRVTAGWPDNSLMPREPRPNQ